MDYFYNFLRMLIMVLSLAILIRSVLTWITPEPRNAWERFIFSITDPIILPIRKVLPRVGIFDFSAFIAILILTLILYLIP